MKGTPTGPGDPRTLWVVSQTELDAGLDVAEALTPAITAGKAMILHADNPNQAPLGSPTLVVVSVETAATMTGDLASRPRGSTLVLTWTDQADTLTMILGQCNGSTLVRRDNLAPFLARAAYPVGCWLVESVPVGPEPGVRWRASCACGWSAPGWDRDDAEEALCYHLHPDWIGAERLLAARGLKP